MTKRVTVTLPDEIVEEIDLRETNRSRFLAEAARRELARRRREELERSLDVPHVESGRVAASGLGAWGALGVPADEEILDADAGRPVCWEPDRGWEEGSE